jgi:uncharacterized protein YkwD
MKQKIYSICWPVMSILLLVILSACTINIQPFGSQSTTTASPTSAQEQQLANYVFDLLNKDRAAQGLAPYVQNAKLAKGAHLHNVNMAAANKLEHQTPGEPELGARVTNDGINWNAVGENVGVATYPDPQQGVLAMHQGMMAEQPPDDGHRQNILNKTFHLVGIDIYIDAKNQIWLTEDFAREAGG